MTATTVLLSGEARKRFGRKFSFHLDTNTPAEAIRAMCAVVAGFREYLSGAKSRGIEFAVWRGEGSGAENIGYTQLGEPSGGTIRIAPVLVGSKSGVLTTIVGAVLIVVGAFGSTWGWWAGGSAWGPMLSKLGYGMVTAGVSQMLSPQPHMPRSADAAQNQPSYIFNGSVNASAQGGCVPDLYGGPMEIGSVVVSARIDATDYSSRPSNVDRGTPGGSWRKTPYDDE